MSKLFRKLKSFNVDISSWDTSSVTDMSYMFYKATAFNQAVGDWDVSLVRNMEKMFKKARNFNQDLTGWQVGQMTMKTQCERFCSKSNLNKNNAPSLPKVCLKGCK